MRSVLVRPRLFAAVRCNSRLGLWVGLWVGLRRFRSRRLIGLAAGGTGGHFRLRRIGTGRVILHVHPSLFGTAHPSSPTQRTRF